MLDEALRRRLEVLNRGEMPAESVQSVVAQSQCTRSLKRAHL